MDGNTWVPPTLSPMPAIYWCNYMSINTYPQSSIWLKGIPPAAHLGYPLLACSVSLLKDSPTGNHLIWTICIDVSSPWGHKADGRQQLLHISFYAADFRFLLTLTIRPRDTFVFLLNVLLSSSKEWPCIYTTQTKGTKVEKHGTQWSQFPRAMYSLRLYPGLIHPGFSICLQRSKAEKMDLCSTKVSVLSCLLG